uniref:Reverse transcriptase zinc-binding domain-containing protein n=1 Tax=Cajanus cajan TaxID=3821 RepID=A0A151R042_CAJCA|nr:hypothetical protein KK1_042939 [Cajanus cajan]
MWRLVNSSIPTIDNLIRRNITLEPQQTLCPFCKSDVEMVSHIFCTCPLIDKVWKQCLSWINCPSPLPMQVIQHLSFLPGMLHSQDGVEKWHILWMATTWTLWRHRNKCIFQGGTYSIMMK